MYAMANPPSLVTRLQPTSVPPSTMANEVGHTGEDLGSNSTQRPTPRRSLTSELFQVLYEENNVPQLHARCMTQIPAKRSVDDQDDPTRPSE